MGIRSGPWRRGRMVECGSGGSWPGPVHALSRAIAVGQPHARTHAHAMYRQVLSEHSCVCIIRQF